jgi:hypothetical protein
MELLNGKAKELFLEWVQNEAFHFGWNLDGSRNTVNELSDLFLQSVIIEWFDSVDYFIVSHICSDGLWDYEIYNNQKSVANGLAFQSRQEATTEAIKKANDIINLNQ